MRSVCKPAVFALVMAFIGIVAVYWLYFALLSRERRPQGATLVHLIISPLKEVQHDTNR